MDADICIIQECEKLKEDYFPNAKFFWTGRIENKGLGVLIKNGSASLDPIHNPNLINFLPIRSDNIKILGVWAYNHRARKFGNDVSGETIAAIEYYKKWLANKDLPCVFGGDFNNSVIWDKPNKENNFQKRERNSYFNEMFGTRERESSNSICNIIQFSNKTGFLQIIP